MSKRDAVIAAAHSWIKTPYHSRAHVKGHGVDCGWLLIEVYAEAGVIEPFDPGEYAPNWHLHRSAEMYLDHILTHGAEEIERDALQPGDIIVVKFGRTYSHGAIYIGDGNIIHAYVGRPVDVAELNEFIDRPKKYYRVKGIEQ